MWSYKPRHRDSTRALTLYLVDRSAPMSAPCLSTKSSMKSWSTTCTSNNAPSSGSATALGRSRVYFCGSPEAATWRAHRS